MAGRLAHTSRPAAQASWEVFSGLRRYLPVAALAVFILTVGLMLRLALWYSFGSGDGVGAQELLWILPSGLFNDADEAIYLLAPFVFYLLLVPDAWHRSAVSRALLSIGTLGCLGLLLYLSIAEYYFFEEFSARFNLVAVDYLAYPNEVLGDVWEEYPVLVALVASLAVSALLFGTLRRRFLAGIDHATHFMQRLGMAIVYGLLVSVSISQFQTDSLALSGNRVANEIATNGISSFFRALRTLELDYRGFYPTLDDAEARSVLARQFGSGSGQFVALKSGQLARQFAPNPAGLGRMNVVVVVMESFGAEFSRLYGGAENLTPRFDALARQSLWFSTVYASGTRTVRGLEAISASFPPIPSVSILRRPGNEGIATWGRVMRDNGYRTSFLYGGFGYFDNMNYYFGQNGFDVVDRRSIDRPEFTNIWGVSDQDLYATALHRFDDEQAAGRPFFSIIMTTSNHKPFTFPAGIPGVPEKGGGRSAGVRYADYALGEFIDAARHHSWFEDTVFVVLADHGARVYGQSEIPLKSYRIPLLVYSPRHIRPRRIDTVTAQIDLAPTVLGLLGLPYRAPFFGRDALSDPAGHVVLLSHNHDVALLREDKLVVLGLNRRSTTYLYDAASDHYTRVANDRELEKLAIAYYQVASDLFHQHRYL